MRSFKEYYDDREKNESIGDMVKGVGNYFGKVGYPDEYWELPKDLQQYYDQNRKKVELARKSSMIGHPLINVIKDQMARDPAAREIERQRLVHGQSFDRQAQPGDIELAKTFGPEQGPGVGKPGAGYQKYDPTAKNKFGGGQAPQFNQTVDLDTANLRKAGRFWRRK